MTHSFRFSDSMEDLLKENKKILSQISGIPEDDLSDTAVINFCLSRVNKDYREFL